MRPRLVSWRRCAWCDGQLTDRVQLRSALQKAQGELQGRMASQQEERASLHARVP